MKYNPVHALGRIVDSENDQILFEEVLEVVSLSHQVGHGEEEELESADYLFLVLFFYHKCVIQVLLLQFIKELVLVEKWKQDGRRLDCSQA